MGSGIFSIHYIALHCKFINRVCQRNFIKSFNIWQSYGQEWCLFDSQVDVYW